MLVGGAAWRDDALATRLGAAAAPHAPSVGSPGRGHPRSQLAPVLLWHFAQGHSVRFQLSTAHAPFCTALITLFPPV